MDNPQSRKHQNFVIYFEQVTSKIRTKIKFISLISNIELLIVTCASEFDQCRYIISTGKLSA